MQLVRNSNIEREEPEREILRNNCFVEEVAFNFLEKIHSQIQFIITASQNIPILSFFYIDQSYIDQSITLRWWLYDPGLRMKFHPAEQEQMLL